MLGTSPAIAGKAALLATFDVEQFLPVIIGAVIGLGVVVAGLFMLRNKSASIAQAPDPSAPEAPGGFVPTEAAQPQPPVASVIRSRNPLWRCVVPGLGLLVLGAGVFGVVLPFFQDLFTARDTFESHIKSNVKAWSMPLPVTPPVPTPQFPIQQQQIQIPTYQPNITPPPMPAIPRIPQPIINRGGMIRPR